MLTAAALLLLGGISAAAELHRLPFDQSLSVYVGYRTEWDTKDGIDDREAEGDIAAFAPSEEPSDKRETRNAHRIGAPTPRDDWVARWFACETPVRLHVVLTDDRHRLDEARVSGWHSHAPLGRLEANRSGTRLEGTIALPEGRQLLRITVVGRKAGAVLTQIAALEPSVSDAFVFETEYWWQPNGGDKDRGPDCPAAKAGLEPGEPTNCEGKKTGGLGYAVWEGCAGCWEFPNDTANPFSMYGGTLYERVLLRRDRASGWRRPWDVTKLVLEKLDAIESSYQTSPGEDPPYLALEPYTVLPFSKGTAHWPVKLQGKCHAVICFPYAGLPGDWVRTELALRRLVRAHGEAGVGTDDPAGALAGAIAKDWGDEQRAAYSCGPPAAVASLWALVAEANGPPFAATLDGISAPVVLRLEGRSIEGMMWRDDPLSGHGRAELVDSWLDVPPPEPKVREFELTFGQDGRCTVDLPKGFNYRVTATPDHPSYGPSDAADTFGRRHESRFSSPTEGEVEVSAPQTGFLRLTITTTGPEDAPAPAHVELYRVAEGGDVLIASGDTETVPETGDEQWHATDLPGGTLRLKARARAGGPWYERLFGARLTRECTCPMRLVPGG